jgi:hypothetical protein
LVSSCNSIPPPAPIDARSAGLCIAVSTRAPITVFSNDPETVLFVELPESGEPDFRHGVNRVSNFTKDGCSYLLNAEPGRYVAVACYHAQHPPPPAPNAHAAAVIDLGPSSIEYTTYFPIDMIRASQVEVKPGAIAFMGSYVVDQAVGLEGADEVQLHYYRLLVPGRERLNAFVKLMSGDYHYRGTLHACDRSEAAIAKFYARAEAQLARAGWAAMIQ